MRPRGSHLSAPCAVDGHALTESLVNEASHQLANRGLYPRDLRRGDRRWPAQPGSAARLCLLPMKLQAARNLTYDCISPVPR